MPGDFKKTHEKILSSAEAQFLEKGYERTNLREICRGAGVTVGAFYNHFKDKHALFAELVGPCVNGLKQIYDSSTDECFMQLSSGNLLKAWDISFETAVNFINFIYDHFTGFRLLILCSNGTRFSTFIEDLVMIEVEGTYAFFKELEKQDITINKPPHTAIHMLTHSFFTAVFECVVHEYEKEDALKSVESLVLFFTSGWKKLLGLD